MHPGAESLVIPLVPWALHSQDAAPREQLPQQPPGIHIAVDVDLPGVQGGMPGIHSGAQSALLLQAMLYLFAGLCVTALHNSVDSGIEAMRPRATQTSELVTTVELEVVQLDVFTASC